MYTSDIFDKVKEGDEIESNDTRQSSPSSISPILTSIVSALKKEYENRGLNKDLSAKYNGLRSSVYDLGVLNSIYTRSYPETMIGYLNLIYDSLMDPSGTQLVNTGGKNTTYVASNGVRLSLDTGYDSLLDEADKVNRYPSGKSYPSAKLKSGDEIQASYMNKIIDIVNSFIKGATCGNVCIAQCTACTSVCIGTCSNRCRTSCTSHCVNNGTGHEWYQPCWNCTRWCIGSCSNSCTSTCSTGCTSTCYGNCFNLSYNHSAKSR